MTLVKRNAAPHFPSVLDELLNTDWLGGRAQEFRTSMPAVNVIEGDKDFTVELAAPGLKKEDFNIELNNDLLTIFTENKDNHESEGKEERKYTRREFGFTAFKRSFNLPDSVNTAEITANYTDGILTVGLPKREEAQVQPSRMIEIK